MNSRLFDHLDLRVTDLAAARKFYDGFIPALGFPATRTGEGWISYCLDGDENTTPFIGLNEDPTHQGNANRFAFWADSKEEVDRLGKIVVDVGARNVEGPMYCPEYAPGYYAVFFEDADGNRWEICCRNASVR